MCVCALAAINQENKCNQTVLNEIFEKIEVMVGNGKILFLTQWAALTSVLIILLVEWQFGSMAWIRTETKEQSGTTYKDIEELNLMSHSFFTLTFIYSVTKGGGGGGWG